jgi:hypothetical protein
MKEGRCGFCDHLRSLVAILEAAIFECKKRDTRNARSLGLLQPHIRPEWLIQQYRDHVLGHDRTTFVALEGQQQVLRATFPGIRDSVKELIGRMKVRKHRPKKPIKCPCLKGWVCEDHPNQPWGIEVAQLPGNCARIRGARKILTLFFYPSIAGRSQGEEDRLSEKLLPSRSDSLTQRNG